MTSSRPKVVVLGILFWYPLAGVTYQFLHYLIGLRNLGYDPYYVEASASWVYDPELHDLTPDALRNIAAVAPSLEAHGFGDRWAFPGNYPGGAAAGLAPERLPALYREAVGILNVTGQELTPEQMECPRRVYVETDPGSSQIRVAEGDPKTITALDAHDIHFSFGENLGADDCPLPLGKYSWLPTRQPVVTDLWRAIETRPRWDRHGRHYTTIATWQNPAWKNITHAGETYYWSKDREFEKILELPLARVVPFELATRVSGDVEERLAGCGWIVERSNEVSRDTASYQSYIASSRGEFTVAKDLVVRLRTGWFSDRSACYLAAGRPVITSETGFSKVLPTGRGLFGWSTRDDILAAVDTIEGDYDASRQAAGEIAEEHFGAERVLDSLMTRAGLR